jgi:hypothetical protein
MRANKHMLFQFSLPAATSSSVTYTTDDTETQINKHVFRDHLLSKATTALAEQPSHSLARLDAGQVILHSLSRSLTFTQVQQLASLARLTHERHFDIRKYDMKTEILVPGGLVLGLCLSACSRDLHEVLQEEVLSCAYINACHPETMVGAISYVSAVDDNLPGDLELVTVTTLGIKGLHVKRDLDGVGIPAALFQPGLFTKEMEQICKESCPILSNKIVIQVVRKILRQTSHRQVFLL